MNAFSPIPKIASATINYYSPIINVPTTAAIIVAVNTAPKIPLGPSVDIGLTTV